MRIGNVPTSTIDDTDNILFAEGEAPKKAPYGTVKSDMLGIAELKTTAPKAKEAINEMVQGLLDIGGYGVISGGLVAAQTVPNMTVQVSECILKTATGKRQIAMTNLALTITSTDTTNARIDIVYVNSSGIISYLQGIAASTPIAPTIPTDGILLSQINIAANATNIISSNIIDKRKLLISTDWLNSQLSDNMKVINPVDDTGSANIYVITLVTAPTTYVKYQAFRFIAKTANTGASTLNVNGLGAKSLVKDVNISLVTGDILIGQIITAIYDGTNFQIVPDYNVQLTNKIPKTSIVNNLLATVTGSVLDATQGKVLNDSINSILNFINMSTQISNLNNATKFGVYKFDSTTTNTPVSFTGVCLVIPFDANFVIQMAFIFGTTNGGYHIRQYQSGTFSAWVIK